MNDVELKALELKRKAWEVLDGKAEADVLFQELYRLERASTEFLDAVSKQLEADNGRWSPTSGLPNVEVRREASTSRIEEISFHALAPSGVEHGDEAAKAAAQHEVRSDSSHKAESPKAEFKHVGLSKSAEKELLRISNSDPEQLTVIVWRSDYGDRAWLEQFADDVSKTRNNKTQEQQ